MLAALLLTSQIASAQIVCSPSRAGEKKSSPTAVCGPENTGVYFKKAPPALSLQVIFHDPAAGRERLVTIKKPGLNALQMSKHNLQRSGAFKKALAALKKDWKTEKVTYDISSYEIDRKTPLFSSEKLKSKLNTASLLPVAHRGIASETTPLAGGVRHALSGK